ncbi:protein kinase domain-containing protein [Streptomyces sp. NPDC054842]
MEPLREGDPERIGGHELFALLGEGGWGNVYFARTGRGRSIALKTIRPECLEENPDRFRRRFAREVEAAQAVDPRHTAEVVDFDTHAAEPWFASRYIAGVNLAEALDHCRNPLPLRTWRVLAAGLARALHSVHDAGLVHRDLKLANVLLAADGAYVIDFGIARHLSPTDGGTLTGTGSGPRTTSFAAPEQLRDERVGPACDVFALGVVLACTALNRHPFGTGSPMEIAANVLTGKPSLNGLPPEVERVVRPCLEPEPGNRPAPAEISALLGTDASPQARDWLPPGLRATIDRRSRFAIDIDRPLRPRGTGSAAAAGAALGLTIEPTPPEAASSLGARPLREGSLTAAPAAVLTETEVTARPAASAPGGAVAPGTKDVKTKSGAVTQPADIEAMRRKAAHSKKSGDWEGALLWYRRAADAGNPTAAREAAQLIEKHFPDRRFEALPLYRMAADRGESYAKSRLTELRADEQQRQTQEAKREPKASAKPAASAGAQSPAQPAGKVTTATKTAAGPKNTRDQQGAGTAKPGSTGGAKMSELRRAAVEHEKQGRLQQALNSYAQAAEQPGDTASKRDVARLCLLLSTSADSPEERRRLRKRAVRLHRKLAQDGDAQSIRALAELGLTVDSRDQHENQLETQLRAQLQSAGQGSSKAMRAVARTYLRLGGEEYVQAALSWLRLAGESGNTGAMLEGARAYEELGQLREALEWYRWAQESGDGSAVPHIERLAAEHPGAALMSRLSRRLRRAWS